MVDYCWSLLVLGRLVLVILGFCGFWLVIARYFWFLLVIVIVGHCFFLLVSAVYRYLGLVIAPYCWFFLVLVGYCQLWPVRNRSAIIQLQDGASEAIWALLLQAAGPTTNAFYVRLSD